MECRTPPPFPAAGGTASKQLVGHWDGVSVSPGKTIQECVAYLKHIGAYSVLHKYGLAPFCPLSRLLLRRPFRGYTPGGCAGHGWLSCLHF